MSRFEDAFLLSLTIITAIILAPLFIVAVTTGGSHSSAHTPNTRDESARLSPGLGMTYTGKIGIEAAPGLVMTPSGRLSPGFGF